MHSVSKKKVEVVWGRYQWGTEFDNLGYVVDLFGFLSVKLYLKSDYAKIMHIHVISYWKFTGTRREEGRKCFI